MNIENLAESITAFNNQVILSGFKRDPQDYTSSLPSNQNNIVALREIASNIHERLHTISNSDLPNLLKKLIRSSPQFTEGGYYEQIVLLISDKTINLAALTQDYSPRANRHFFGRKWVDRLRSKY